MSFFKKLKDRMFKSSSKIDEGLDAIVQDGGEEEEIREEEVAQAEAIADPIPEPEPEPEPEPRKAYLSA